MHEAIANRWNLCSNPTSIFLPNVMGLWRMLNWSRSRLYATKLRVANRGKRVVQAQHGGRLMAGWTVTIVQHRYQSTCNMDYQIAYVEI